MFLLVRLIVGSRLRLDNLLPSRNTCSMIDPVKDLISVAKAAKMIGVSRQRVDEYLADGRLTLIMSADKRTIARKDVARFKKIPRKDGRPKQ